MEFVDTLWNHREHSNFKFHRAYNNLMTIDHDNTIHNPGHSYGHTTHQKSAHTSSISSDGYASTTPGNSPTKKRSSESLNPAEEFNVPNCLERTSRQNDACHNGQNAKYGSGVENLSLNCKHTRSDSGIYSSNEAGPINCDLLYDPSQNSHGASGVCKQLDDNTMQPSNSIIGTTEVSSCWNVLLDPTTCPSQISQIRSHSNDIATEVLNENSCFNMSVEIERHQISRMSTHYNNDTGLALPPKSCLAGEDTLTNNCSTIMDMLSIDNNHSTQNNRDAVRPLSAHPKLSTFGIMAKQSSHVVDKPHDAKNGFVDDDLLLYDEDINLNAASDIYFKSQGPPLNTSCFSQSDIQADALVPMPNLIFTSSKSLTEYMSLFQELSGNPPGSSHSASANMVDQFTTNDCRNIKNEVNMTPDLQNIRMQQQQQTSVMDQSYVKTYDPLMSAACCIGMRSDALVHISGLDFGGSFSFSNIHNSDHGPPHSTDHDNDSINPSTCQTFDADYQINNNYSHYNSTSQCNLQSIPQLLNELMATGKKNMLIGSTSSLSSISSVASSMSTQNKDLNPKVKRASGTPPSNANYETEGDNTQQQRQMHSHSGTTYQYASPPGNMSHNVPLGPRSYPTRLETDGSIIKSLLQPALSSYNANNPLKQPKHYSRHESGTCLKPSNDVTSTTDLSPNPYYYHLNSQNPYMFPNLKRYSRPILPPYDATSSLPPIHNNIPISGESPFTPSNDSRGCGDVRRASDSLVDTTESTANEHSYHHANEMAFTRNALDSPYNNNNLFGNVTLKSYTNGKYLNVIRSGSFSARSRDQRRAEALDIPFSIEEIIYSPIDEFTDILRKHNLTDAQISLIRDIRRRGKNKVAAQNCRKRKIDGIMTLEQSVDYLKALKVELLQERTVLERDLQEQHFRYDGLYSKILTSLRDENGSPYSPKDYMLQFSSGGNLFLIPKHHTSTSTLSSPMMMKLGDS